MKKRAKLPSLCDDSKADFDFEGAREIAAWTATTFDDLVRVEMFQLAADTRFVLVLVNDDPELRAIFVDEFNRCSLQISDVEKRYIAMSTIFRRLDKWPPNAKVNANLPHLDILLFPSNWREVVHKLAKEYTVPSRHLTMEIYFSELAKRAPIEVL